VITALTPADTALSAWGVIAFVAVIALGVACAVILALSERQGGRPGLGDDIHRDGTPLSEAEIERMIRNYPDGGDR
jgi:hypothetical protein